MVLVGDRWSSLTPAGEKPEERITSAEGVSVCRGSRGSSGSISGSVLLPTLPRTSALPLLYAPVSQYKLYLKFSQLPSPKAPHHSATLQCGSRIYLFNVAAGSTAGASSTLLASWLRSPASYSRVAVLITSTPFILTSAQQIS